jgi:hypothetical protein
VSDMKTEWGSEQTLADYHLRCFLFNFGATIRCRTERIEMSFDVSRVSQAQVTEAVVSVLTAVATLLPDSSFRVYVTDLGLHGVVANTAARDFLKNFTKDAPTIGPSLGAGCVFYFGQEGERLSSNLTIDLSAAVPEGVFVRTYAIWDGGKVKALDLPPAVALHLKQSLDAIGLERSGARQGV